MIRKGLIWSGVTLAIMLGIILWVGAQLPTGEKIPVHFDITGTPDRYGSKSEAMLGFWIVWGTTAFTAALLAGLPKIMPRQSNFEKSAKAYLMCWYGLLVLMLAVTVLVAWTFLKATTTASVGTAPIKAIFIGVGLLFIVIGNYLPKTRSNWLIGIRTPWTLSSEITWEKTHRMGGRLFLGGGFLMLVTSIFLPLEFAIGVTLISSLGVACASIAYSWWVWRTAIDREDGTDFME